MFLIMNPLGLSLLGSVIVILTASLAFSAEQNWAGEYADKNLLGGKAVLQMSIEQSGNVIQVAFDAVYNDGHGAAPEATGPGKISSGGVLEFKWEDRFKNAGTGTIKRAGDDIIVSMKATRVTDPRCLPFYGQNMRLKRTGKRQALEHPRG